MDVPPNSPKYPLFAWNEQFSIRFCSVSSFEFNLRAESDLPEGDCKYVNGLSVALDIWLPSNDLSPCNLAWNIRIGARTCDLVLFRSRKRAGVIATQPHTHTSAVANQKWMVNILKTFVHVDVTAVSAVLFLLTCLSIQWSTGDGTKPSDEMMPSQASCRCLKSKQSACWLPLCVVCHTRTRYNVFNLYLVVNATSQATLAPTTRRISHGYIRCEFEIISKGNIRFKTIT